MHTHTNTKDYFHFAKLQTGCISMLCMFCQGSTMNFIDLFITDNPSSKHLLCFLQSQKHTTLTCKGSGHYYGPSLRERRHYREAEIETLPKSGASPSCLDNTLRVFLCLWPVLPLPPHANHSQELNLLLRYRETSQHKTISRAMREAFK